MGPLVHGDLVIGQNAEIYRYASIGPATTGVGAKLEYQTCEVCYGVDDIRNRFNATLGRVRWTDPLDCAQTSTGA